MKIIRYLAADGEVRYAAHRPDGFLYDLTGDPYANSEEGRRVTDRRADIRRLLTPVAPAAIIGLGINYKRRPVLKDVPAPEQPAAFGKTLASARDPGSALYLPSFPNPDALDYEGQLAVIIGRACKGARPDQALGFVLGYTAAWDVADPTWQRTRGGGRWTGGEEGAGLDTFCPIGPCLVTPDEIPRPDALRITTTLTDILGDCQIIQERSTGDMLFRVAALIAFLSADTILLPGTIILTGAPHPADTDRQPPRPPRPLRRGDMLTVAIEKVGALSIPVRTDA